MNISTEAALNGIKSISILQNISSHNVANVNTDPFSAKEGLQVEASSGIGPQIKSIRDTGQQTDLAESMTNITKNQHGYSADLRIIKVQDRMIGDLIDILA